MYLAGASVGEQLTIIGLIVPQAMGYATGQDFRGVSSSFCKISSFLYTGGGVFALVCLYLGAIHRYLQTCRSVTKRQWMTLKKARLLFYCAVLISIILGLPFGIFRSAIPSSKTCDCINATFAHFSFYFYAIVGTVSPIVLWSSFGYLTWRNVRQTRLRQVLYRTSNDIAQQVTRMIVIQTTTIVVSILPGAALNLYAVLMQKDSLLNTPIEQFILTIAQILVYTDSCTAFYLYLIVSPTFRRSVKEMLRFRPRCVASVT
ncbi:unnamed protein product [Rotaria sp. Silwood2]|nr:unnamed protein product [Rotaria sp. Silwood2]CAF4460829.1 unnamed protein product [Rotaria sp. Silwood2]